MIYKRYPKLVLSRFVSMVWDVLTPYISICLSESIFWNWPHLGLAGGGGKYYELWNAQAQYYT